MSLHSMLQSFATAEAVAAAERRCEAALEDLLHKNARLIIERDEALACFHEMRDQRDDAVANEVILRRQITVLMEFTPSDLRELDV